MLLLVSYYRLQGFPGALDGTESACNSGDPGLIPGSERALGEGNDYPFHCSCLENPMHRGAWWAKVHGVAKSWTQLSMHVHTCTLPSVYLCQFLETLFYFINLS